MNLYLISQDINNEYDTYDSVVVAANNEREARETHPSGFEFKGGLWSTDNEASIGCHKWVHSDNLDKINVKLIGATDIEKGVVLASFNAG